MPCSAASAASSATGWTVPTSLLAHIAVTSATSSPCSVELGPRARPGSTRPCASTGSQLDLGALVLGRASRTASSTAWCSTALASTRRRRRVGGPAGPEDALDREVVALGAAAGEDHLGRPGAERGGDPLAGLLDQAPGPPARRRAATTRCRRRPAAATYASTASGSIGVVAA